MGAQALNVVSVREPSPPPCISIEQRKHHILVAEDDVDMRRFVATILRGAGHKVAEARDGMEILDRIEGTIWSERPDLFDVIVSDINMPGLSGLDVLAALRCTHWSTPVVLITAFGDDEIRAEARELGAAAILDKPFDPDMLRTAVEKAAWMRPKPTPKGPKPAEA